MGNSNGSDGLTATVYGYNPDTDIYGPVFNHVSINNSGSYSINYTAPAGYDGFTKLYFIFGTNTGGTDPHYFYMDNFVVAKAGAIPDPNGPPANIQCSDQFLAFNRYFPDLLMHKDYYAGGMLMPGRNYNPTDYRFGYGSHEKIDEVSGTGNTVDMGDRWLDTRLMRTPKPDSKAKKYPDISPYAYAGNNPIIFIDPDGEEIRIAGTAEFQTKTVAALQKLTNDKLELKNGVLFITKMGAENPDKNFKEGTSLIRELNKKGDGALLYNIVETKKGNEFQGSKEGGEVRFNPDKKTGGHDAETLMGSGERPAEIGLGHELIHAKHRNQKGLSQYAKDAKTATKVEDPDQFLQGKTDYLSKEELETRKGENLIRKEQGVPARAITIDDIPAIEITAPKEEKK
jgi:RHS repeat-associated protein